MNEEDIFDSFPGIVNVIASDAVRTVSYMKVQYEQEEHVRKSFYKSLLNSAYLRSRA